jgi:hypothetical protein
MPEEIDYDIGHKLGYYILAIFLISALFLFLAIFIGGIKTQYYKSDYGVNIINMEERVFGCISYVDPITTNQKQRVIDLNKFEQANLDNCVGTNDDSRDSGVLISLTIDGEKITDEKSNNAFLKADIEKEFPVLIYDGEEMKVGKLQISFWKI